VNPLIQTPAGLPPSIDALRGLLRKGDLTVAEALTRQQHALLGEHWHCVEHVWKLPSIWPNLSLPLAGVGLAHKDIFVMPQRLPHCGAGSLPSGWQPTGQASVVQRLSKAGAPPLAMLGMAPFAGGATAESETSPPMINPIDAAAVVGGSSSGSGVAVAAGLCYASLGTDTAGSVRMPAATCGVMGLKTTHGLLSTRGVAPLAPSLDTVGVLARCSADLMTTLSCALNPLQARELRTTYDSAQRNGLHIAVSWTHTNPASQLAPEVAQALDTLADELNIPTERAIEDFRELQRLADVLLYAEAADVHAPALRTQAPLPRLIRTLALAGSAIPATWYLEARREQSSRRQAFLSTTLANADILLTPALPRGVPDAGRVTTTSTDFQPRELLDMFSWMSFVNYLGLPAIVVPIACDTRGRPISVQAVARPGKEGQLIAWAQQLEERRPDVFSSLTLSK